MKHQYKAIMVGLLLVREVRKLELVQQSPIDKQLYPNNNGGVHQPVRFQMEVKHK